MELRKKTFDGPNNDKTSSSFTSIIKISQKFCPHFVIRAVDQRRMFSCNVNLCYSIYIA